MAVTLRMCRTNGKLTNYSIIFTDVHFEILVYCIADAAVQIQPRMNIWGGGGGGEGRGGGGGADA